MPYKQKAFSRAERKQQVIDQFNMWHRNGDTNPKTMGRIARALDMTPSSTFRDLLLEMEIEGSLECNPRGEDGRYTVRHYSLTKHLITEKYLRRKITVSKRGVAVGQLEMAL
jgi:DNA-binding IclR family transcriptional regulator